MSLSRFNRATLDATMDREVSPKKETVIISHNYLTTKIPSARNWASTFLAALIAFCFSSSSAAQQPQSSGPNDNGVIAGFASGRGSDIDLVNLYNGHVSLNLPLIRLGGRGTATYSPSVSISRTFVMRHYQYWVPAGSSGQWSLPTLKVISENYNDSFDYSGFQPGLGPAVLIGRKTRDHNPPISGTIPPGSENCTALTKLYLRLPGGEIELRDVGTNGEPHYDGGSTLNRGREWHSVDGSGISFLSDADIQDETCGDLNFQAMNGGYVIYPTGYLMMGDGSQFRFIAGQAIWSRDRNGNTLTFGTTTTDSIGRQYQIAGGGPYNGSVTYKGFDGTDRVIGVTVGNLSSSLRSDFAIAGVQTLQNLFPSISARLETPGSPFNPVVTQSIHLPNNKEYRFFYDAYGELARVELPTGGTIEYDYGDTIYYGTTDSPQVFRRISARRVFDAPAHLQTQQSFAYELTVDKTITTVTNKDSNRQHHERRTSHVQRHNSF